MSDCKHDWMPQPMPPCSRPFGCCRCGADGEVVEIRAANLGLDKSRLPPHDGVASIDPMPTGCQCEPCEARWAEVGVRHWSDCAVHNAPAMPPGPCSCMDYAEARYRAHAEAALARAAEALRKVEQERDHVLEEKWALRTIHMRVETPSGAAGLCGSVAPETESSTDEREVSCDACWWRLRAAAVEAERSLLADLIEQDSKWVSDDHRELLGQVAHFIRGRNIRARGKG